MHIAAFLAVLAMLFAAPGFAQPAGADNYHMGPGDSIHISVYNTPNLTLTTRINDSGNIDYPLLGTVHVGGMTTAEAADTLASGLEQAHILRNAHVTVTMETFRSHQVTVVGSVVNPGTFYLTDERSIIDVLAEAGWITKAGADYILLTRQTDDGSKQLRIDLAQITSGKRRGMLAQAGDRIFVPKEEVFYIQGAVQQPGVYRYRDDMTVMQALSIGGGLTPRGSRSSIEIKRRSPKTGKIVSYDAELTTHLAPDDVIVVNERWF
ncbi:MAG: polysaccharide biosynthesis/export family protein [Salinisphaera sp.]|nr:polysaccharide biosynthesis/export family protein [Salinisphaera sp.]